MAALSVISDSYEFAAQIAMLDPTNIIQHCYVEKSTLGGVNRASLCVKASLQGKSDWNYGIFHNSQYGIFVLNSDDKLSLISSGLGMPKFRKCKVKSLHHAAEKIVAYFASV